MKQSAENAASNRVCYKAELQYGGVKILTVCVKHAFKHCARATLVSLAIPRNGRQGGIHGVSLANRALLVVISKIRYVAVAKLCFQLNYVGNPSCSVGRVFTL